eukprot:g17136.t1
MQENNDDWKEVGAAKVAVPPLSALLDMRVPVVEVEAGRLHAAMSWLYAAVQKLQQQHVTTSEELQQLQEQAKHAITKAARGCKEELASLARLVHMDAAVERRQLQERFLI